MLVTSPIATATNTSHCQKGNEGIARSNDLHRQHEPPTVAAEASNLKTNDAHQPDRNGISNPVNTLNSTAIEIHGSGSSARIIGSGSSLQGALQVSQPCRCVVEFLQHFWAVFTRMVALT
eukprot:3936056-Rhodomonas_salina.1